MEEITTSDRFLAACLDAAGYPFTYLKLGDKYMFIFRHNSNDSLLVPRIEEDISLTSTARIFNLITKGKFRYSFKKINQICQS